MMSMTYPTPDESVMKAMAKSLRKHLPEGANLCHSKALEVVSNAFGFSSWHAFKVQEGAISSMSFPVEERGYGTDLDGISTDQHRRYSVEVSQVIGFARLSPLQVKPKNTVQTKPLLAALACPKLCELICRLGFMERLKSGQGMTFNDWGAVFLDSLRALEDHCVDGVLDVQAKSKELDLQKVPLTINLPQVFIEFIAGEVEREAEFSNAPQGAKHRIDREAILSAAKTASIEVLYDGKASSMDKALSWRDFALFVLSIGLKVKAPYLHAMQFTKSTRKSDTRDMLDKIENRRVWGDDYADRSGEGLIIGSERSRITLLSTAETDWTEVLLTGIHMVRFFAKDGTINLDDLYLKLRQDNSIPLCEVPKPLFVAISDRS